MVDKAKKEGEAGSVSLEGPDTNNDGKPDWTFKVMIKDPRVLIILAIVTYIFGVWTGTLV